MPRYATPTKEYRRRKREIRRKAERAKQRRKTGAECDWKSKVELVNRFMEFATDRLGLDPDSLKCEWSTVSDLSDEKERVRGVFEPPKRVILAKDLDMKTTLQVAAHECVHVRQYQQGKISGVLGTTGKEARRKAEAEAEEKAGALVAEFEERNGPIPSRL